MLRGGKLALCASVLALSMKPKRDYLTQDIVSKAFCRSLVTLYRPARLPI